MGPRWTFDDAMRPTDFDKAIYQYRHDRPAPCRLAADVYLDLRHPDFVWFEHLGLIRAERAEVVLAPGVLEMLLTLAGPRSNTLPAPPAARR
jgi:hypothetical protein